MADILILKPSSLGDVVHTLPCAAILRRSFPKAWIRWLVNSEWVPLLAGNPHIDEVIEFPRREFRGVKGALRIAPWARRLRERVQADLILDYQGLLRSALIAKLCRDDHCRVLGLSDAREGARLFYDEAVDVSGATHAVDRYLALTRHVVSLSKPSASQSEASESQCETRLMPPLSWPLPWGTPPAPIHIGDRFLLLHPFSRGAGKSLTSADVAAFCASAAPRRVVIAGRSDEPLPLIGNAINLLNATNIPELIWLLRNAQFVVSVDSGPMHIASAVNAPLVSIHTWSDPAKVGPYREDAWVLQNGRLFQQRDRTNTGAHLEMPAIRSLAEFICSKLPPCA
jgi:heptosyltransferase I